MSVAMRGGMIPERVGTDTFAEANDGVIPARIAPDPFAKPADNVRQSRS